MNTRATIFSVYLLFACAPVAASQPDVGADAADDEVATDTAASGEEPGAKHEDILDRALSPLDEAVSNINRHLNKDDGSPEPEQDK